MADAFIVKDRIESIEAKFDLMISEEKIRNYTLNAVKDAIASPIDETKKEINMIIDDATSHISNEYTRINIDIEDKFLDAKSTLTDHVTESIRDIEKRFERIEFMMKLSFCINAVGMIGSIIYLLLK
jgi:hypothetical protein